MFMSARYSSIGGALFSCPCMWTEFEINRIGRTDGMLLLRLDFKKITVSILGARSVLDHSPLGKLAARRATLCSTERLMWQETGGGVWPAAREEMRSLV